MLRTCVSHGSTSSRRDGGIIAITPCVVEGSESSRRNPRNPPRTSTRPACANGNLKRQREDADADARPRGDPPPDQPSGTAAGRHEPLQVLPDGRRAIRHHCSVSRGLYPGPMPLPDALLSFWYEAESLAETCLRTPWGVVITDSRYPTIYDANHAGLLEEAPDLTLEEVRVTLHPLLRSAGATHEHIEVMDVSDPSPATDALRREQQRVTTDVVMRHEGDGLKPQTDARVEEIASPDDSFWS